MPIGTRRWMGRFLIVTGAALLAAWAAWNADATAFQYWLGRRLEALGAPAVAGLLGRPAWATRHEARTSGLVGRIEIPRIGLSAIVVEGSSGRALRRGVGHVEPTPFPGERGNVALAAHRDTYFRRLSDVMPGDSIRLATPDGVFAYRVDRIRVVGPERNDLLAATRTPRLTLVTCYPFDWVGPAPRRFVVIARPLDAPAFARPRRLARRPERAPGAAGHEAGTSRRAA